VKKLLLLTTKLKRRLEDFQMTRKRKSTLGRVTDIENDGK